jgi:hypothetical protein
LRSSKIWALAPGLFLSVLAEKPRALLRVIADKHFVQDAQFSFGPLRPTKQLAEKVCTGQESNASGAKALIGRDFMARLKSGPDTKREFFCNL